MFYMQTFYHNPHKHISLSFTKTAISRIRSLVYSLKVQLKNFMFISVKISKMIFKRLSVIRPMLSSKMVLYKLYNSINQNTVFDASNNKALTL